MPRLGYTILIAGAAIFTRIKMDRVVHDFNSMSIEKKSISIIVEKIERKNHNIRNHYYNEN